PAWAWVWRRSSTRRLIRSCRHEHVENRRAAGGLRRAVPVDPRRCGKISAALDSSWTWTDQMAEGEPVRDQADQARVDGPAGGGSGGRGGLVARSRRRLRSRTFLRG